MSAIPEIQSNESSRSSDPSGRDRLVFNVLASWGSHLVFLIAGFVLPRLVDHRLGQHALGVWDFGWAAVAYYGLSAGGLTSAVNRFVARQRTSNRLDDVNIVVSSASSVLFGVGVFLAGITVLLTWLVPRLLNEQLADCASDARWIVFFLGMSLTLQIASSGYAGVLTGYHRWGIHNGINAGTHAGITIGMIAALLVGGGLREMAIINFCGEAIGRWLRYLMAHRVCPTLKVKPTFIRWSCIKELISFGGKSFLPQLGDLLLTQTVSILIMVYLGPATLALYSRPRSLIRHVRKLVQKLAMVLTPTAGSLQIDERADDLRILTIKATRYTACLVLPVVLMLVIHGGPLLRLWMGSRYENGLLLAVLSLGFMSAMLMQPCQFILAGLNAHGRIGLVSLLGAIGAVIATYIVLGPLKYGVVMVALSVSLSLTLTDGFYTMLRARLFLGISLRRLLYESLRDPLLCMIPYTLCLLGSRLLCYNQPYYGLALSLLSGGLVLAGLYWRYTVPQTMKNMIMKRLPSRTRGLA